MGDGFDLVDFEDDPYWPYENEELEEGYVTAHPFLRELPKKEQAKKTKDKKK